MNIENKDFCTGCHRHCPVSALQCRKGRRLFGLDTEDAPADHANYEGEGKRSRADHGGKECHCHKGHHGHREHYGEKKHCHNCHDEETPCWEGSDELLSMMGKCNHLLSRHPGKGRGQDQILHILSEKKCLSQRQLQEILGIQPGSISEILTKLEHKGFIHREKNAADKRAVNVRLTETGAGFWAEKSAQKGEADFFACLSEEEKETLRKILRKLLDNYDCKNIIHEEK